MNEYYCMKIQSLNNKVPQLDMSSIEKKFVLPNRYQKCSKNIWSEFTQMVNTHKPLDLTMGCPDFSPSKDVIDALAEVAKNEVLNSQLNDSQLGQTNLMEALAKLYSKILKRKIDPRKELITMATGCQCLHLIIMSFVGENDEVIIIEPYFDFYETLVNIAGGKCKFVPLRFSKESTDGEMSCTSDWTLYLEELEDAFNVNTKLFILNTPNNPSGKVFTLEELSVIANLCKKWNVVCLSDEVYEFIIYQPNKHVRIATLPDMWERTITMICPGKTFGVAGWELGVAYSSEELITKLQVAHQNIVHSNNIPIQEAFAILYKKEIERLDKEDSLLNSLSENLKNRRDLMIQILKRAGMKPTLPEGGFFILADWTSFGPQLDFDNKIGESKDFQFARWMIENVGLAVIPSSAFYSKENKHLGEKYIRVCFYKKTETLNNFENILQEWSKINLLEKHIE